MSQGEEREPLTTTVPVTEAVLDDLHDRQTRGERLNEVIERALRAEDGADGDE
jgi:hypothetical protein